MLRCFDLLCDLQSSFLQCNTRLKCLSLCQILVKSLNNWYFEVDTWLKLLLINSRRVVPYNNIKLSPLFLIQCLVISLCLNFVHLLAWKPNLEKCSIYSNKFFHNFHLSKSSFTCSGLRPSGLAWRLGYTCTCIVNHFIFPLNLLYSNNNIIIVLRVNRSISIKCTNLTQWTCLGTKYISTCFVYIYIM